MAIVKRLDIFNFRAIKKLSWHPSPGLNCLIGPGDSGKSTLLDAIDLALSARRSYVFTDADFFNMDTSQPIEIVITLGRLEDDLNNLENFGGFLRGFNNQSMEISDEPNVNLESVLTVKLTVGEDLEPDWTLYSDRANKDGREKRLSWKNRELISPARLGVVSSYHLAWGGRSVLNKLSEEKLDVAATLAAISRKTRANFEEQKIDEVSEVLKQVQTIGSGLGVALGELKAALDVNGVSLSNGAIALHSGRIPLRQLGTGSSRLLISGLQKNASNSKILLVDEAEFGLEPYRITRLLNELGSKKTDLDKQVFITTHSPYVLRELASSQLHVVRRVAPPPKIVGAELIENPPLISSHIIYSLGGSDREQAVLRVCAESFFSHKVIVAEGKTEIGLIKGVDQFCQTKDIQSINACGVNVTDGGGDSMFERASVFASLGYRTAIFKDSDKAAEHSVKTNLANKLNIEVFEWGHDRSTEEVLFAHCLAAHVERLLEIAINRKSKDGVNSHIMALSNNEFSLESCLQNFQDIMRTCLGKAAKKYEWFKDIEPFEQVARDVLCPDYAHLSEELTSPINQIFAWARG